MRISVGADPDEVEPVARAILKGLERHHRNSRPLVTHSKHRENGLVKTNGSTNGGLLEAYR